MEIRMTKEQEKFSYIKNYKDYDVVGDDIDFKVFADCGPKKVVLQFEESDSRNDWINNILFIPWPVRLGNKTAWTTLGYARAYKSTHDIPFQELLKEIIKHPDFKVVIRGWSFGSVMAKLSARHYFNLTQKGVDELTTFGDVKCWLNPFYKNKAERLREYVTPNDFITWCVPFYHRDKKCKVGRRFSLKEIFKSEYYHTHYDEYDYSKYE